MRRRVTWLDVFTDRPLTGNQLAVVHDADGLDAPTMLAAARETRLSETTFVQRATEPGADYRNRIFSMPGELDFAGHPSLGTAVAVARARGQADVRYVQQTRAGLQPVDVALDGDRARASMLQEPAAHGAQPDVAAVLKAAGLEAGCEHPDLPPQVVSTGQPHLIAPVRAQAVLGRAEPRAAALRALLEPLGAMVLYLVALDADGTGAQARGFFAVPGGLAEDPATGSAAGPLCAYLHVRTGVSTVRVRQGVEMGRPSVIDCELAAERVRVAGDVVVVADGEAALCATTGAA